MNLSSFKKYAPIGGRALVLFLALFVVFTSLNAQNIGDYRSISSGNYTTLSTWQRWSGTAWLTPSTAQGYPGQNTGTGVVTIKQGHQVTVSSAGIATQVMGKMIIESTARLYLTGSNQPVNFSFITPEIDIASGGSVYFFNKSVLVLPQNASISVTTGGLVGDGCNANKVIIIGGLVYAQCLGGPSSVYSFDLIMSSGGTLSAVPTSSSYLLCEGGSFTLDGAFEGYVESPAEVHYSWRVVAPGGAVSSFTTIDVIISNAVVGQYSATLTVTTTQSGATYSDSETILINVNPLPTLGGATQPITACPGSGAVVQLTGLVPSNTFELYYTINAGTTQTVTGLISSPTGTSSFVSVPLTAANNGQSLQITGIKITNPASNCTSVLATSVTLSVWQEGRSTWIGSMSADWHTVTNWCGGIPTVSSDVFIPQKQDANYFYPIISTSNAIARDLNLLSGASLSISGTNTLELKGNWSNAGSFTTTTGTVSFTGTVAQTLAGTTTFQHLSVNNAAGLTASNDITVNGDLSLLSANASATKGSLDMWDGTEITTLFMGPTAVNLGTGEVTGRIQRNTLVSEQTYTFGHPNTNIRFYNGDAPTTLRFITKIGATHPTKNNTIKRFYEIIKSGGLYTTRFSLQLHYLESELNDNVENNLVYWDHHIPYPGTSPHEHGKSSQDTEQNTIVLSGHSIGYIVQNEYYGEVAYDKDKPLEVSLAKIWMVSEKESSSDYIWLGAANSDWNVNSNWSGGNIPDEYSDVIIPIESDNGNPLILDDNTNYIVGSISIEQGAIVTAGDGTTLNVYGDLNYNNGNASWQNKGSFIPGTSTVVFHGDTASIAGETNFYNLSIDASAELLLLNGSMTRVSNTFNKAGSLVSYLDGPTLFGYNGDQAQSVVKPDDFYYHLELTGAGTKTLPADSLHVKGDLTLSAPAVFTGNTLNLNGTALQTISGTQSLELNNLRIYNAAGVSLVSNQSVDGVLQLTNGLLTTAGATILNMTCDATYTGGNSSSYVNGKLSRTYCGIGVKTFPIGKGGYYRPLTYELTALTGASSTLVAEQIEQGLPGFPGSLSADFTIGNRYWLLSQTGASAYSYKISLDGTPDSPGFVDPKIVRNDTGLEGGTLTAYDATFATPLYVSPAIADNTLGAFTYGVQCSAPTINTQPVNVAACKGTSAEVSVIAGLGDLTYLWQLSTSAEVYIDIEANETYAVVNTTLEGNQSQSVLTINNTTTGMNGYKFRVVVARSCGSNVTSEVATLTVNALPSIQPANSEGCSGNATVSLSYTNVVGSPDNYKIDWNAEANTAGFVDVTEWQAKVFGTSGTITLTVPTTVEGSYGGMLYLRNSILECVGEAIPFTITLNSLPQGSLSGSRTCSGSAGYLTWSATSGTGPFTVIYKNPSNVEYTANGVVTGVPFQIAETQSATTTYTLVSVSGTKACPRTTGFTGATADIVVESGLWTGAISTDWHTLENWCGGVPTLTTDVFIPSNVTNQPVISATGANCRNIIIESGASVSISGDYSFTVAGTMSNSGLLDLGIGNLILNEIATVVNYGEINSARPSGSSLPAGKDWTPGAGLVYLKGATAQTIPTGTFHDLVVDNTAGVSLLSSASVEATNSLQIYRGKLTVGSGTRVEASSLTNYVGVDGLLINGTSADPTPLGTLIFKNDASHPVQATVQMYTKAYYDPAGPSGAKYKWQFFGIPVLNTSANPTFNGSYVRVYDETKLKPASQWVSLGNSSILDAFKAYEVTQVSPKTLTFKGELVNENKTIQLTYTEGGNYPGQNLLANPYTAALRIGNITFGPATEATIYLYNTGSYSDWTSGGSGGVGTDPGQYVAIPKNIAAMSTPPDIVREIPSMQAFLLKKLQQDGNDLDSFYVKLNYSSMTANNTTVQRVKKEKTEEPNPFTSIEVKGARYSDKMWIFTVEGCTRGFDNGWDGPKMWGGAAAPQIYAAEADGNYQVNSVDDIDESYLGFRPGEDSSYSITFTHDNLSGKSKQGIYLVDLLTSEITDISASPSVVHFNAEPKTPATMRFKIVTGRNPRVIEKKQAPKVEILNISGKLFIDNKSGIEGEVVIHNLNGLLVYRNTFKGMGRTPINTKLKQGVYMVTASTTQETVTQSVVLEK